MNFDVKPLHLFLERGFGVLQFHQIRFGGFREETLAIFVSNTVDDKCVATDLGMANL